ncbi:hypothetical protein CYY_006505 [Polysphondylium violaceum]|uniref:Carbohydrate-binding domain-containing protein n=1 Tax=Polysphondylium violaceum TaxID=133409 RepID=A0A8J4PSK3_9MYCE|nr:hypothetical protein CYY_006505 [Polysphondylium violaceum]
MMKSYDWVYVLGVVMVMSISVVWGVRYPVATPKPPQPFTPFVTVYPCDSDPINWPNATHVSNFRLVDNSSLAVQQTDVSMCYDETYLNVKADCFDNNIQSPYSQCNQDLFNADVFEIFLAYGPEVPTKYLEIELSPYGVLFVSKVANTDDFCTGVTDSLIECGASGIVYNATIQDNEWVGILQIPLSLIQETSNLAEPQPSPQLPLYRINMYRIDIPASQEKEYSCWNPTDTSPPCFHKPSMFGTVQFGSNNYDL